MCVCVCEYALDYVHELTGFEESLSSFDENVMCVNFARQLN